MAPMDNLATMSQTVMASMGKITDKVTDKDMGKDMDMDRVMDKATIILHFHNLIHPIN